MARATEMVWVLMMTSCMHSLADSRVDAALATFSRSSDEQPPPPPPPLEVSSPVVRPAVAHGMAKPVFEPADTNPRLTLHGSHDHTELVDPAGP